MIERIDRSYEVAQPLDEMVRWCRSGESRLCWPGASKVRYRDESLRYDVAIRTPGIPEVTVQFEEQLSEVEGQGAVRRFRSVQLWNAPSGQLGTNWSEFSFTALGTSRPRFDFTLHFMVAAQSEFDPVRYRQVSERTVDHYVAYLVQHAVLFRTVECSVEVAARPVEVVEFCRSPEARQHWPGVGGARVETDVFVYDCGLAVAGIPDATLVVRERQGPLEEKGRVFRFETESLWVWPGGELLNLWPTYQVSSASKGSSLLELTARFVAPSRIDGKPVDQARLDKAVQTAAQRFLHALAQAIESPSLQRS